MSELSSRNLSEPKMVQKFEQYEPDPNLNSEMSYGVTLKFE